MSEYEEPVLRALAAGGGTAPTAARALPARTTEHARSVAMLETLEAVYREHAGRFRRVALAIVGDVDTAEDVVQEAFARAVARRRSFRASGAAVGWIWRIVVNTALSRRRRDRLEDRALARLPLMLVSAEGDPHSRLREHLARLPERQKLALFLHYYADLDYELIGSTLSIAPGTVGKLLHDARANIRRAVEDERGTANGT